MHQDATSKLMLYGNEFHRRDRELLECPKCGLLEDVLIGGELITYLQDANGQDTGLRFDELAEGKFSCPACGSIVQER